MVKKKEIVIISIEKPDLNFMIKLDDNERFIRSFDYMLMDIIIIGILHSDNIGKDFFVEPNLNYQNSPYNLINKKILVAHFPKGLTLQITDGPISKIKLNQNEFIHKASTDNGSSGGLIIEYDDYNVFALGIHKQGANRGNISHFIHPICKCLENDNYIEKIKFKEGTYRGEIKQTNREGYGKLKLRNGEIYIGQWKNDKRDGYGIEYYKNKKIKYKGYFKDNEYNGKGKYIWENGEFYKGNFKNSIAQGEGEYHYLNGDIYKGNFVGNLKEGIGTYFCLNGNYFTGEWKNNVQSGYGEYYENQRPIYKGMEIEGVKYGNGKDYYSNGDIKYEGEFFNDIYHGQGKLYINNESKYYLFYEGKWNYGQRCGKGIEYYSNGKKKYDGEFNNNLYHGNGTLFFQDGNQFTERFENINYKGNWKFGIKNGRGKLYFKTGYYYDGDFVNDQMHGKGVLSFIENYNLDKTFEVFSNIIKNPLAVINDLETYATNLFKGDLGNIKEYDGNFVNNKKEGFGTCRYKNGASYSGEWKNDKYDGKGVFFKKMESILKVYGKMIKKLGI